MPEDNTMTTHPTQKPEYWDHWATVERNMAAKETDKKTIKSKLEFAAEYEAIAKRLREETV